MNFVMVFSYENCARCAICKSHLAVLVVIHKSQLAVRKKASKKPNIKMLMNLTPGGSMGPRYVLRLLFSEKTQNLP
jgi:hypothetical protein